VKKGGREVNVENATLADLVEELVELKIELRRWEESMSERSDVRIEEIKGQIEAVKAAINARQDS
jgi:molybdopterin converting factor small subunit